MGTVCAFKGARLVDTASRIRIDVALRPAADAVRIGRNRRYKQRAVSSGQHGLHAWRLRCRDFVRSEAVCDSVYICPDCLLLVRSISGAVPAEVGVG